MNGLLLERVEGALDGQPYVVGLADENGQELVADWYLRQRYAPQMEWTVGSTKPWDGGTWPVGYLVVFDGANTEVSRQKLEPPIVLCGAIKPPPMTPQQIKFRKKRGMPLADDPYRGDTLVVSLD